MNELPESLRLQREVESRLRGFNDLIAELDDRLIELERRIAKLERETNGEKRGWKGIDYLPGM